LTVVYASTHEQAPSFSAATLGVTSGEQLSQSFILAFRELDVMHRHCVFAEGFGGRAAGGCGDVVVPGAVRTSSV
jgi:hypothetical protein